MAGQRLSLLLLLVFLLKLWFEKPIGLLLWLFLWSWEGDRVGVKVVVGVEAEAGLVGGTWRGGGH